MFCFMMRLMVAADTPGALPLSWATSNANLMDIRFFPVLLAALITMPPTSSAASILTMVLPLSERVLRPDVKPTFARRRYNSALLTVRYSQARLIIGPRLP